MSPLSAVLAVAAAAAAPVAHGPPPPPPFAHSVAEVNDARSHGAVGDNFLSLNEAIQLFNRTLLVAQLSAAETAQLSGPGADISIARIDALRVPNVTIERDLDVLRNLPHGLLIEGYNGGAQLDFSGAGVSHGFRSDCDLCSWHNLELVGGPYGIDVSQTDASFGGAVIQSVICRGQAQFGVRVRAAQAMGRGRLIVNDCVFFNVPVGIEFDEAMADRWSVFAVVSTRFINTTTAIDCALGARGQTAYLFRTTSVQNSGTGIRVRRPAGADRAVFLEATHLRVLAGDGLLYDGLAGATSDLELRMLDVTSSNNGTALRLGPLGGGVAGVLHDCTLDGDVRIETGGGIGLDIGNLRVAGGSATFGTTASAPLMVVESRFDNCAVTTSGQGPVAFTGCCFVGGSLLGTAAAPIALSGSYSAATAGAHVTQASAVPAAQLGSMTTSPALPALGGTVTLSPDLPAGLLGLFVLGPAADVGEPLPGVRTYFDLAAAGIVGVVQLRQPVALRVPVNLALLGTAWVAQIAVVAAPGMQAPALQAPPGDRFAF